MDAVTLIQQWPAGAQLISLLPAALLDAVEMLTVAAGTTLVFRDAPVRHVYFLLDGEVIAFNETESGRQSVHLTMPAPDIVSDLEVLAGQPAYAANIMTTTDCTMLRCDALLFEYFLGNDPVFLRGIGTHCARKSFRVSYDHGTKVYRSGLEKVAGLLLAYCRRQCPQAGRDTTVRKTRQMMASELFLSVKTVNRALATLREQGQLSIIRGKIQITQAQYDRLEETWGTLHTSRRQKP